MAGPSLHFFPASLPDELLHSRISRYHFLSGNYNDRQSLRDLFGRHTLVVTSHLPSHLARLSSLLPEDASYDVASIIENETLFPYFRPFLSEQKGKACVSIMAGDNANSLKISMGLVASKVGGQNWFRFCGQCVVEDEVEFGSAYWHRAHLLPGVFVCHRHRGPLNVVDAEWVFQQRHHLFLPTCSNVLKNSTLISLTEVQIGLLHELAKLSAQMLHCPQVLIDRAALRSHYLSLAANLGLVADNGRLRVSDIEYRFHIFLQRLPAFDDFAFIRADGTMSIQWVYSLLRSKRTSTHPLKHLLLSIGLSSMTGPIPSSAGSDKCHKKIILAPTARKNQRVEIDTAQLIHFISECGYSLRQCAQSMNISVTTLTVEARRLGLQINTRPKTIHPEKRRYLLDGLATGTPMKELAEQYGVSQVSLYRLLKTASATATERKLLLFEKARDRYRELLLKAQLTREIRQCREYMWLYRHDRRWLQDIIDKRERNTLRRTCRVNWPQRDQEYAKQIERQVLLLTDRTKPFRITRAALVKSLPNNTVVRNSLAKLPLTREVIRKAVESVTDFQKRRLLWNADQLRAEGGALQRWRLLRRTGLKVPLSAELERIMNQILTT
ncbi:TnsD family Tn7-like transposition protein [Undibacterium sp.]|uniref:TnsD family Tn7-like transposition protein n=1 Tax=Undibacterium sp. TaxID=1914977 RepID=UPI0025FFA459|nr:TnsD family Tn7-like transposition protein [Undibacterium sp.]